MGGMFMEKRYILIAGLAVSLAGSLCAGASAQSKPKIIKSKDKPAAKKDATAEAAEPDKILYDKALLAIKHSRFIEGRLDYQTLINTYPDSEYLAKAKLGVADSFYKEGGNSNLTQAVEEYKNFIVFFPFLDEAAYAQMQVGMAHYKMMEKADRDNSHAEAAEDEFRAFLLKYPQSPLVPQAEQSLRNVQEVLAEGEFSIAKFYYLKKDYRASAARLIEVSGRYPLFSESDQTLWMLGDVYQRAKLASKNEDDKNHWADLAAKCYDRILQDYPGSSLVPLAKERLTSMGMPVPAPKPDALARMKEQQLYMKQHRELAALKMPMDMIKSSPDISLAAHSGTPNLTPPDDTVSAMEVLTQGAKGPSFTVVAAGVGGGGTGGNSVGVDTESVETDSPAPSATEPPTGTGAAVQILSPTETSPSPSNPPAESTSAVTSVSRGTAPAAESVVATDPAPEPAAANATASAPAQSQTAATSATGGSGSSSAQSSSQTAAKPTATKADSSTESTSKKKKGLHKLIPF
jgi:outer membrane protein assembly factor BamD